MDKITFDFKDRTALVTGGAQGFGLDIAKRFLSSGAKVIIWDIDPIMIEKAIIGWPHKGRMFFFGTPFEPPRAGMIAQIFIVSLHLCLA